ncbi:hypothetical protein PFISCL1PPCAC_11828, partial [Pristionchus fissidentatus]
SVSDMAEMHAVVPNQNVSKDANSIWAESRIEISILRTIIAVECVIIAVILYISLFRREWIDITEGVKMSIVHSDLIYTISRIHL